MALITVHRGGGQRGRPIVYLHGFMGEGREFEAIHARDFSHRPAYFLDLPGHGDSDLPKIAGRALFEACASALDALLPPEPVNMVAYSMGGRVALYFALNHPQAIHHLVLESASPGLEGPEARRKRLEWDRAHSQRLNEVGLSAFLRDWYDLPLFQSLKAHPEFEAMRTRRGRQDGPSMSRVLLNFSPGMMPNLWPKLPRLAMPTLYLAGALDEKYRKIGADFCAKTPSTRLQILPGVGHNQHFEDPKAFGDALRAFLGSAS